MCCFMQRVLDTEVDARCNKLANVVGRTSTVAGTVNLVRPRTVSIISLSVHLCRARLTTLATIYVS